MDKKPGGRARMNEVRVRLIFHDSLGTRERLAALSGARAFAKFGVTCDCAGACDRKALRHVKAGASLGRIVRAENPVVRTEDLRYEPIWEFMLCPKTIYGMGVTPHPLRNGDAMDQVPEGAATGELPHTMGVGLIGAGGVLSVQRMLETKGELGEKAISAAVRHELGHVFLKGEKGRDHGSSHCTDEKCIMQANENYADFLRRFVEPALDFCRGCQGRIGAAVSRIRYGF
ncbi:MAG: hypothetical protein PHV13_05490 [Candidatus ainarchaeum sp.]|nr:hypothetical protein [Candidatus ainarchaeum sp.]